MSDRTESTKPAAPTPAARRAIRLRSIHAAVRMMNAAGAAPIESLDRRRRLVAGLCRILGEQLKSAAEEAAVVGAAGGAVPFISLSPRMRQTLERLLVGDSEKEIATRLGLSPHTVHVYVKTLYRRFNVSSRGELFAVVTGRREYIAR